MTHSHNKSLLCMPIQFINNKKKLSHFYFLKNGKAKRKKKNLIPLPIKCYDKQ